MDRAGTIPPQQLIMALGWIAFVMVKFIFWILSGHLFHISIPAYLGQNRCCCNIGAETVTLYYCAVWTGDSLVAIPIDQGEISCWVQGPDGPVHSH